MKKSLFQIVAILLLTSGLAMAQSVQEFKATDPMGRNTVQFKTTAPLEDIVGTTNMIGGQIRLDPKNLKSSEIQGRLEVDLRTLDTGIALRDAHLREQYLHTDRHPVAVFTLERIRKASSSSLKPNAPVTIVVDGSFELHGTTRKVEVPLQVTYLPESESTMGKLPGNLLRITGQFDVKLADFAIERPNMVLLKVGDTAHINVDVFATDADGQKMAMWMEQMKKMMGAND